MLRLLSRFLGLVLLAGGFGALIVDGTRSIAGEKLLITPLRKALTELFPIFFESLQAGDAGVSGLVWRPLISVLMYLPVSLTLCGLGAALIVLSHKRVAPLGHG